MNKNKNSDSLDRGEHWDELAACSELLRISPETFDEYFYNEDNERAVTRMAKLVCKACPVRVECLDDALLNRDFYGVKGGTTGDERRRITRIPRQRNTDVDVS